MKMIAVNEKARQRMINYLYKDYANQSIRTEIGSEGKITQFLRDGMNDMFADLSDLEIEIFSQKFDVRGTGVKKFKEIADSLNMDETQVKIVFRDCALRLKNKRQYRVIERLYKRNTMTEIEYHKNLYIFEIFKESIASRLMKYGINTVADLSKISKVNLPVFLGRGSVYEEVVAKMSDFGYDLGSSGFVLNAEKAPTTIKDVPAPARATVLKNIDDRAKEETSKATFAERLLAKLLNKKTEKIAKKKAKKFAKVADAKDANLEYLKADVTAIYALESDFINQNQDEIWEIVLNSNVSNKQKRELLNYVNGQISKTL